MADPKPIIRIEKVRKQQGTVVVEEVNSGAERTLNLGKKL